MLIVLGEETIDCGLQIDDRMEDAAPEAALRQLGEEAIDRVEPWRGRPSRRGVSWDRMHSVLPGAPENSEPCAGEESDGVRVFAAPLTGLAVDVRRPWAGMAESISEAGDGARRCLLHADGQPTPHDRPL